MKIADIYTAGKKHFSIELIPPRNGSSIEIIDSLVMKLKQLPVSYFSVTWGAGGSLRGGTLPLTWRIREKHRVETMAHLTCRDFTKQMIENILMDARYLGIENILALRGDPHEGEEHYEFDEAGYQYASHLVRHIQNLRKGKYLVRASDPSGFVEYREGEPYDVCMCVACYPEGHIDASSKEGDWVRFRDKVNYGADFAITQMLFNVNHFTSFINWCRNQDITIPIIPGVFTLRRYKDLQRIPEMFGVTIPLDYRKDLEKCKDSPDKFKDCSVEYTVSLVKELLKYAPGVHFYSMNNAELVTRVFKSI